MSAYTEGLERMTVSEADVTKLISKARAEESGSLEQLLDSYRNYLRMLAATWLDNSLKAKADESDLVQETMLKAYERFNQFAGQSEVEMAAWLRKIMSNNLIDIARRYRQSAARRLHREQSLEDMAGASSAAWNGILPSPVSSPSHGAARKEFGIVLANALAALSPDHRQVIVLRQLKELDWDTIAAEMDRTTGAVRMLWARALKQLRPLLQDKV